jgi:GTP cyclohydrolase I
VGFEPTDEHRPVQRSNLRALTSEPAVDLPRAERAVAELLEALGLDPSIDENLRDTPRRVAATYAELVTPRPFSFTTFPNEEGCDELILVRGIPFQSLCEHHLLPLIGIAHVGYVPRGRIVGLSKLARVVELFARGLQVQERLTTQITESLEAHLAPKGVGAVLEAEHLCMTMRGVRASGARTITSALHGIFRNDARSRAEFLSLAGVSG